MNSVDEIAETIRSKAHASEDRFFVSISGPPGSGKSTTAEIIEERLDDAIVLPMDGFHYDNAVLDARGLRDRKGAPNTFDVAGYAALLERLRHEDEVAFPVFDREADLSRCSAKIATKNHRIILAEGNYLLLNVSPWSEMIKIWDFSVKIDVPMETLNERLIDRWRQHGLSEGDAYNRAMKNDIPNAEFVIENSVKADLQIGILSL